MLEIHTAYRYDFWKCRSITERILLIVVAFRETDSSRHLYVVILSVISVNILNFNKVLATFCLLVKYVYLHGKICNGPFPS